MTALTINGPDGKPLGAIQLDGYRMVTEAQYQALLRAEESIQFLTTRVSLEKANGIEALRKAEERAALDLKKAKSNDTTLIDSIVSAAKALERQAQNVRITSNHLQPLMASVQRYTKSKE